MMKWLNENKFYFLFIALTFIFYQSSIDNDFSLDDKYVFENIPAEGTSFKEMFSVFAKRFDVLDYRPIAMFTFAIEQYVQGSINPKVSHVINLFLYIFLCCIIYYVLKKLPIKNAEIIALIATLLFIVHPVHCGVVNNLKSRDGLFSMLFMFLAINAYINYEKNKSSKQLILLFIYFIVGVNAKRDAFNLVFIIPLLAFFVYNKNLKKSAIYLVLLLAVIGISSGIINYLVPIPEVDLSNTVLLTENPLPYYDTIWNKLGMAVSTYFQYIKFIFVPKGYYFYFGYNQIPLRPIYHYITLLQLLVVLIPLLSALFFYKKSKMYTFGILFFYVCLLAFSNIYVPVQGILADRYVFIASLGMFIAFAVLIVEVINLNKINNWIRQQFWKKSTNNVIVYFIVILIVMLLFPFVQQRNKAWQDILTLIETDMPYLTESFEANRIASTTYANRAMQNNLQSERENQFLKALQYAKQANKIHSKDIYTNETEGIAYYGLGKIVEAEKKFKSIIKQFDTSVVSWDLLGDITFKRGNFDSAALCYYNVNRLEKNNESFYYKYPNTLYLAGKRDSAFQFLTNLNKQYPNWYTPYESASYLYFYNENKPLKGMEYMVIAFEKGLRNKDTYQNTLKVLEQGMQNENLEEKQIYTNLYKRLKNIVIN
jgi:tetratricopeptide (TPR) repeat protein